MYIMEFKDRLKKLRTDKKLSQNELAKSIDVHVTNISRYERGENKPTTKVLSKLANALETTTDYLMSGSTSDIANNTISDKELLSLFNKANQLSDDKKVVVKELLEAFIFKSDIQNKLAS